MDTQRRDSAREHGEERHSKANKENALVQNEITHGLPAAHKLYSHLFANRSLPGIKRLFWA